MRKDITIYQAMTHEQRTYNDNVLHNNGHWYTSINDMEERETFMACGTDEEILSYIENKLSHQIHYTKRIKYPIDTGDLVCIDHCEYYRRVGNAWEEVSSEIQSELDRYHDEYMDDFYMSIEDCDW